MGVFARLSTQRQGEAYALSLSLIEAFFPIFAFYTVNALGGLHAYFYSLVIAVFGLGFVFILRRRYHDLYQTQAYRPLLLTSFFITIMFALIFIGLQYTTPAHAALIMFLQVLFSYLMLGHKQEEKLDWIHLAGASLMTIGALIILFPKDWQWNLGDLLILLSSAIAPIANSYQKQTRKFIASETVLLGRSLLALPVIYLLAGIFETRPSWTQIEQQAVWLILTGLLVFVVSKIFWIEALHRLPITKVNALFALSPLLTIGLAYWLLNQIPDWLQLLGAIPILVGSLLITRPVKKA